MKFYPKPSWWFLILLLMTKFEFFCVIHFFMKIFIQKMGRPLWHPLIILIIKFNLELLGTKIQECFYQLKSKKLLRDTINETSKRFSLFLKVPIFANNLIELVSYLSHLTFIFVAIFPGCLHFIMAYSFRGHQWRR